MCVFQKVLTPVLQQQVDIFSFPDTTFFISILKLNLPQQVKSITIKVGARADNFKYVFRGLGTMSCKYRELNYMILIRNVGP